MDEDGSQGRGGNPADARGRPERGRAGRGEPLDHLVRKAGNAGIIERRGQADGFVGAKPGPIEVQVDEVGIESEALRQPLKLNPGIHSIVVRQGDTQRQAEAMLSRGENRQIEIDQNPFKTKRQRDRRAFVRLAAMHGG